MQDDFITFLYFCALDDAAAAASVYERVIKLQKTGRNCVVSRIVFQSFHDSLLDEVEKISAQHDLDLGLLLHCAFHLEPFFKKVGKLNIIYKICVYKTIAHVAALTFASTSPVKMS